ncbi:MAG: hypothetical protein ACXVWF_09805 [Actinomycetota bacterium]
MPILAVIVPEVHGILELVFLGLLLLLLVLVVVFGVYVFAQQVRNPGRPLRR